MRTFLALTKFLYLKIDFILEFEMCQLFYYDLNFLLFLKTYACQNFRFYFTELIIQIIQHDSLKFSHTYV